MLVNYSKYYIVSFIADLRNVVQAITEKAMDTSMRYDTQSAWKLFSKEVKKFTQNLGWRCTKMKGGVSIFLLFT